MHLLHITGYSLLFDYFIYKSDKDLSVSLDLNEYDDSNLLEVKTPLHLPYYNASTDYERVEGEIELEGIHYSYVKRKVSNDTLYLLCIPNAEKTKLYNSKLQLTAQAADRPSSKDDGIPLIKKSLLSIEYNFETDQYQACPGLQNIQKLVVPSGTALLSSIQDPHYPPPKAMILPV